MDGKYKILSCFELRWQWITLLQLRYGKAIGAKNLLSSQASTMVRVRW